MSTDDPGDLLPGEPACVMCEVNLDAWLDSLGKGQPFEQPFPHRHHNGRTPLTGCRSCFEDRHDGCDPHHYFCSCTHAGCAQGAR